jgi:phosphate transport system protein
VLNVFPAVQPAQSLKQIGKLVHRQLRGALAAYHQRDTAKALAVWQGDQDVDEIYAGLFRECLTYMMEDPRNIAACSHLLFIAKNVERVGDLATNIGEMAYYLITGHSIAGPRPKRDMLPQE